MEKVPGVEGAAVEAAPCPMCVEKALRKGADGKYYLVLPTNITLRDIVRTAVAAYVRLHGSQRKALKPLGISQGTCGVKMDEYDQHQRLHDHEERERLKAQGQS